MHRSYQLASFHQPDSSSASFTCDRKPDKLCISRFNPSSVHILKLLSALYGPPARFWLIGMPSRCHTSRSVLNRLPYCSRLYLTLKTQLTFLSIALSCVLPSRSTTSVGGQGRNVRGDILPSDTGFNTVSVDCARAVGCGRRLVVYSTLGRSGGMLPQTLRECF